MFGFFGAPEDMFQSELMTFKTTILNLYRQRTKLSAERESLRFQYVTSMKARLSNIIQAIYNDAFQAKNADAEELLRQLIPKIMMGIPMVLVNGQLVDGFAPPPSFIGGPDSASLLSPMPVILQKSIYDGGPKIYKEYVHSFTGHPDQLIGRLPSEAYTMAWSGKTGGWVYLTLPPTREYVEAAIAQHNYAANLIEQFDFVNSLLQKKYSGKSLIDIVQDMFELLTQIVQKTTEIVQAQLRIDQVELQIQEFAASYSDHFASPLNASDLLNDLRKAAEGDEEALKRLGLFQMPTGATQVTAPEVPELISPDAEKKSNLPWLIGGAIAIFMATR